MESVAFHPDGERLVSGSRDRSLIVWDLVHEREVLRLRGHDWWVHDVTWSPDGSTIASGSKDGTIRLWETRDP